jgi:hypothetical protein
VLEVAHGPFLETRASSVEVSEDACVKSKSLRLFLGTTNSWNQGSLIIQISKYQQEPDASYYNEDIFLSTKRGDQVGLIIHDMSAFFQVGTLTRDGGVAYQPPSMHCI